MFGMPNIRACPAPAAMRNILGHVFTPPQVRTASVDLFGMPNTSATVGEVELRGDSLPTCHLPASRGRTFGVGTHDDLHCPRVGASNRVDSVRHAEHQGVSSDEAMNYSLMDMVGVRKRNASVWLGAWSARRSDRSPPSREVCSACRTFAGDPTRNCRVSRR